MTIACQLLVLASFDHCQLLLYFLTFEFIILSELLIIVVIVTFSNLQYIQYITDYFHTLLIFRTTHMRICMSVNCKVPQVKVELHPMSPPCVLTDTPERVQT